MPKCPESGALSVAVTTTRLVHTTSGGARAERIFVELSFFINAVKRRPWIIILFIALGAAAGQLATPDAAPKYYSRAVLNVSPPSQSRVAVSFSSDPDRYVIGQLSVLNVRALIDSFSPSSQGLALGSTSLPAIARARPTKLVDGKAKPCHDEREVAPAELVFALTPRRT